MVIVPPRIVVAVPVERPAGRGHRGPDAVPAGQRRRRDEPARDLDRPIPVDAEPAGRAARVVGVAGLEQAGAEVAREGVDGPADDRDPGRSPSASAAASVRSPTTAPVADRGGSRSTGTPARRDAAGSGHDLVRDERRGGDPGQAEREPLPGRQVPAGRRGDGGLVALDPERGRQAAERPAADAGRRGELVGLGRRARVEERDRRPGRLAPGVDRDERRPVAVDADRDDLGDRPRRAARGRRSTTADHQAPGSCSAQPWPPPTSSA